MDELRERAKQLLHTEAVIRQGGGEKGLLRQRKLNRMTARERIAALVDRGSALFELNIFAGFGMYEEWGGLPAAGVVTVIGKVSGRDCLIVANDATVKAGAFFPQTVKKVLRAQAIAMRCRLPVIYLVDSSGVFLPLQEEIFPDEDDFGRIFRNNAKLSAMGVPQFAAIMGNCIAGGGYLPVLCDQLLMTEGSGLYLAGPSLVKAAIGQEVDTETLGGARMHAEVSGTVDYLEPDDMSCLQRLKQLAALIPEDRPYEVVAKKDQMALYDIVATSDYDMRGVIATIVDDYSFSEYKSLFGKTIVCGFAEIGGIKIGIVANQKMATKDGKGEIELGGVIYGDGADKAARFVVECDRLRLPLLFLQDVNGFMVGRDAEQSGIIRRGAQLVHAVSTVTVPKLTVVVGNSFGAGNYALCGKAYDPHFIVAWPGAHYAVMGATQSSETLFAIEKASSEKHGEAWDEKEALLKMADIEKQYKEKMDIRYGAARGWIDAIVLPETTRETLIHLLRLSTRGD